MANSISEEELFAHDWYGILGCNRSSTRTDVEKAARKLFLQYHPDKTKDPDAPGKFLLVQKAKEILLHDEKRREIDDKNEKVQKRKAYDTQKVSSMDERRKKMKQEFDDRLRSANQPKSMSAEEVLNVEVKKRNMLAKNLRRDNISLMEEAAIAARKKADQKARDFVNHRKNLSAAVGGGGVSGSGSETSSKVRAAECCQVKIKWKRNEESESEDSLYQIFKVFGSIEDVALVRSKGSSALVTFTDASAAISAVSAYVDSDKFRVSLLDDKSESSTGKAAVFSFVYDKSSSGYQQHPLAQEMRLAAERAALEERLEAAKSNSGIGPNPAAASTTSLNSISTPVAVTAQSLAEKESNVLTKIAEMARKRKEAQLLKQQQQQQQPEQQYSEQHVEQSIDKKQQDTPQSSQTVISSS